MRRSWPGLISGLADRLPVRLLILMSLALLPLGAISISTTLEVTRSAVRAAERNLVSQAADAVAGERALVESALASARALRSLVVERLDDPDACSAFLQDYVAESHIYSYIALIGTDGHARCVSGGQPIFFGDGPGFREIMAAPLDTVTANPQGVATGLPVVVVSRPVHDDGDLLGFLSLSLTQRTLELMGRRWMEDPPAVAALLNHRGAVINLDVESPDHDLLPDPDGLARAVAEGGNTVLRERMRAGGHATYALAELIPRRLYALAMWPDDAPQVKALHRPTLPLVIPAAMWLASLAVVLFSIHHLVLRHLKALNRQVRRFALGQREDWAALPGRAPAELRELHATFRNMSRLIARDELEREQALADKTVLLKELNHRVKNNLQLIASIINLQLRRLDDDEGRRVLRGVQDRVMSLASVHRALYDEQHLASVQADEVIRDILSSIVDVGSAPGEVPDLTLRLDPVILDADRMLPLSFLLSEAVTNALKHMSYGVPAEARWIEVMLRQEPATADGTDSDTVVLRLANTLPTVEAADNDASADPPERRGLGAELVDAFAAQLGGEVRLGPVTHPTRGRVWELCLRFPAPAARQPGTSRG